MASRTASNRRLRLTRTFTTFRRQNWPRFLRFPATLEAALDALESDNAFLKAGGVFTDDLIETWVEYKRKNEVDAIRLRPHPYEFSMYYDI